MKTYDFDRIVDRHGTNAVKYDALTDVFGRKELLPLWVADMDFATPDFILDALRRRLDHPVLGLYATARRLLAADRRVDRSPPRLASRSGVDALHSRHRQRHRHGGAGTYPSGDKVVIQPPVYHPFRLVPEQMGRRVVCNPLRRTATATKWTSSSSTLLDDDCRLLLLSNPHNPAGIVWPEETLRRLAAICDRPRRRGRLGRDPLRHGALRASSPPLRIGQRRGGALQRHLRRPDQDLQHRRRGQFLRDRPRRGAAPPLFRLARSG